MTTLDKHHPDMQKRRRKLIPLAKALRRLKADHARWGREIAARQKK